jgi:hypothetical protein
MQVVENSRHGTRSTFRLRLKKLVDAHLGIVSLGAIPFHLKLPTLGFSEQGELREALLRVFNYPFE